MNIHNPEDFALFRITERKGTRVDFFIKCPKSIPHFSDCMLAEDTSLHKIQVFKLRSSKENELNHVFQDDGKGLSLVYRRIDSTVLLPLPSPTPPPKL